MKTRDLHRAEPRTIKAHHIEEHRHDPCKARQKRREPSTCPQCGAVFAEGRWQWEKIPKETGQEICPACHRSNDKYSTGEIILSGAFMEAHRNEILLLVRNTQEQQNAGAPLSRIIDVSGSNGTTVVTTTDSHLPRRIGHALERAFKGKLDVDYKKEEYFITIRWHRDDRLRLLASDEAAFLKVWMTPDSVSDVRRNHSPVNIAR